MKTTRYLFHSHGKLLLTGEYLVLAGARALALPLRQGQAMEVEFVPGTLTKIFWSATDPGGLWFQAELDPEPPLSVISTNDHAVAGRLVSFLNAARSLNPAFLKDTGTYNVINHLTFNREWGWGSSSTLISNIAWWAGVDPYALNTLVSEGSGYDIACARAESPIFYTVRNGIREIEEIHFRPSFQKHIAFIYLGHKQDTAEELVHFVPDRHLWITEISRISEISTKIRAAGNLSLFSSLIGEHEKIMSLVLDRPTVKESLFPGFPGSIKSLGAWGGDYILASSRDSYDNIIQYFREQGFPAAFSWSEIIR